MPPILFESLLTAMWLMFLAILLVVVVVVTVVLVRFLLVATVALQVYAEAHGAQKHSYWWPFRHHPESGDRPKRAAEHAAPAAAPQRGNAAPAASAPVAPAPAVPVDRFAERGRGSAAPETDTPDVQAAPPRPARESRTSSLLSRAMPTRSEPSPERPARSSRRSVEPAEEAESQSERDAAMNRLFAPLSETDSTEPLKAVRPKRSPSDTTPPED
jgi:hypothetical protein